MKVLINYTQQQYPQSSLAPNWLVSLMSRESQGELDGVYGLPIRQCDPFHGHTMDAESTLCLCGRRHANSMNRTNGHLKNIAFMTPCLVALFVCCVLPHVTMSRSMIICLQEVTIHIKLNCIKLLHKFSSCFHIVVDALYIQWGVSCQNHADPMYCWQKWYLGPS